MQKLPLPGLLLWGPAIWLILQGERLCCSEQGQCNFGEEKLQGLFKLLLPRVVTEIVLSMPVFLSVTQGTILILLKSLLRFADGKSHA